MNLLQQQEYELTITTEIQQELIEPSTDFNPLEFAILPSRELPTDSLINIQQTSNIAIPVYRSVSPSEELPTESISSSPGPHTPAYTQPMEHLKAEHRS